MPVPLIAAGVASLIARAAVSTAAKKAITQAAAKGLTKREVAELIVRNEATAAKALAEKGIKVGPKRFEYKGTGRSDPELDAAFRASPEEGSVAAMARRMAAENPEKAAIKTAEKAKVVMARNRTQTVARTAKKKELTNTTPKVARFRPKQGPLTKKQAIRAERNRRRTVQISQTPKARARQAELAEQQRLNPTDAAKIKARVRPPAGYSGAKVVKPRKRAASKPVDTSVEVVKPATKRTPQEVKDAKEAARKRRIAANVRGKITGKKSVTKKPARPSSPRGPEEAARVARLREEARREAAKKDYRNKGRAERRRDVDDQESEQGYWVPGEEKGDPRRWISTAGDAGIPARSTRTGNTIIERSPKVREDLPPKDELTAIQKAFAELTKDEKEAMSVADARAIQGILREKILKGPNRKPAGPKDAPKRNYVPPSRLIETAKARIRARRRAEIAEKKRLEERIKKLTPAQRKAIAKAVARARKNNK